VSLLHDGSLALGQDGTVIAADGMAVRLLAARGRQDLVGRPLEEIFDTRMEDLLAPAALGRQALWPLRDSRLGRRFFASLYSARANSARSSAAVGARRAAPNTSSPGTTNARAARTLSLEDLAGNDSHMSAVIRKATRVANTTLPILIQGPTGSGKECFARALHAASARGGGPFVAVNCAALPETLIESELFGYGPGAFTGARKEGRKGKIVQSTGGTLFLDEIGDMPLLLQTRLLRVLEEQEVIPLGAETGIPVDLRVICASNRDLRELIASGGLREDLYYRLNGITLELPPLSARADKDLLIRRILVEEAGSAHESAIDGKALRCLNQYTWPGNIRELRNVIRSAFAICDDSLIRLEDLPESLLSAAATPERVERRQVAEPRDSNPLATAERATLLQVIRANRGNLCTTAKQLGMSRNALYRRLKRHGITLDRVEGLSAHGSAPPRP
jgi:sigma-54 dependent transcriptional regulator, acetoin dehydrogenase operon transcriptional activator AcoR